MMEGRHLIVNINEWKMIINALDTLELIVKGENIDNMLLQDLKFFFKPDKISELSEKICRIK
jgi:hypothetical protein